MHVYLLLAVVGSAAALPAGYQLDSSIFTADAQPRSTFGGSIAPSPYKVTSRTEYLNDDNTFGSSYTQNNGQEFVETGKLRPTNDGKDNVVVKEGSFKYYTPEGILVSLTYTADEYGFHPISASIPQPPAPIGRTF